MSAPIRCARVEDAPAVGRLLHDFNTEFDTPTPGPTVLTDRLARLLVEAAPVSTRPDDSSLFVLLAGDPPLGIAVVSLRPNVWFDGPVALLDELYVVPERRNEGLGAALLAAVGAEAAARGAELVEINVDEGDTDARRFYERHGFTPVDPDTGERALYYLGEAVASQDRGERA